MKSQISTNELIQRLDAHIKTLQSQDSNINWRTVGELEGLTAAAVCIKYAPISGLLFTAKIEQKLNQAKQVAQERGGKILSTVYEDSRTPLLWQCANPDHKPFRAFIFQAKAHWCRKCHITRRQRKLSDEQLNALGRMMKMDTADMTAKQLWKHIGICNSIEVFRAFLDRFNIPYSRVYKPSMQPDFNVPVTIPVEQLSYLYLLLNSEAKE